MKSAQEPPLSDRQARWVESLLKVPLSFRVDSRCMNNTFADALSRNPVAASAVVSVVHSLLAGLRHRLRLLAKQDPEYQALIKQAENPASDLQVVGGLVLDAQGKIYVPKDEEIRTLIISENHDSPMAGHFGMDRTVELVQRRWVWRGLQRDVREYVRTCALCQRAKHSTTKPPGRLFPIVPSRPWEVVTLDFVSGLPLDRLRQVSQILVIVDKFTKYVLWSLVRSKLMRGRRQ